MESTGSDSGLTAEGASRTFVDSDLNTLFMECGPLAAKWKEVSLCLGLEKTHIDTIAADSKSVTNSLIEALTMWVRQNYSTKEFGLPSWSTLIKAVARVDRRLAEELATKHQCSLAELTPETPQATDENKPSQDASETKPLAVTKETTKATQPRSETGAEMVRSNIDEINSLFTTLLQNVQDALQASSDVKVVWDFLINFFRCSLPDTDDMKQLFQSVTLRNLWSYECYSPLEKLAKRFVPGNKEVGKLMTEYRARLSGFYLTTKIIDFMEYQQQLSTTHSPDDSPPKLLPNEYEKITVVLDIKRRISELSLDYVHNLWVAFAEEYNIPSLTAILDKIKSGSLEVTWVVPTAFVEMIKPRSRFFRRLGITQVLVDGRVLYDENQMASKERKFLALCYEGTAPVNQFSSLLDEGVDPDLYNKDGRHPLWLVSYEGRLDLVELLLMYGATVDLPMDDDTFGETPLFAACTGGHKATAALLVERGAAINYQRKDGVTPLYLASKGGHVELVSLLLEKGADLNKGQQPPLYVASHCGHVDVVKVLVDHGADVNKRCDEGSRSTSLMTACEHNQPEVVRLLIEHGTDVNLQSKDQGYSPLHTASQLGHTAIVQLLLHSKAQLELRNKEGRTALMVASWRGHLKAVVELLRAGALTDSQDQEGLTALILATQNKHSDVVDALLEFKADLNITENTAGWSALFFAVKSGNLEIVKRLIREGANVEMRDKNGLTAAEISDDEVICEELKQHSLCTVSEVQTSQEEQDDTSTDVSQSDHEAFKTQWEVIVSLMYQLAMDPTFEPMFSTQQSPLHLEDIREPPSTESTQTDVHIQKSLGNEKLDKPCDSEVIDSQNKTLMAEDQKREMGEDAECTQPQDKSEQNSNGQDDTSTDVSQSDHEDSQSRKVLAENEKKKVGKYSKDEKEQESKGHVQQQDTQEKKRDLVKKSYQKLLRIFDALEDSLLPGRKEKREYQKKKETPSNITEANQQRYDVN